MKKLSIASTGLAAVAGLSVIAFVSAPVAQAANTTINSQIDSTVSLLTSNGNVNVNVIPSAAGAQTISSDTVTVSTNNSAGYRLQLSTTAAGTALTSGANSIPAASGTQAAPAVLGANTWGYRVDGVGGFGAGPTTAVSSQPITTRTFAGVPAPTAPSILKTTSSTATNDTTTVWYSVAANTSTPSGTYTNSVTYTAVAN